MPIDENNIDDNTLDNAGPVGRNLADTLVENVTKAIDGFPASTSTQRAAIARMAAHGLDEWADDQE